MATPVFLSALHYVTGRAPPIVTAEIDAEIQGIIDSNFTATTNYKYSLAGEIEHEYLLPRSAASVELLMAGAAQEYWRAVGRHDIAERRHFLRRAAATLNSKDRDLWVNFQRRHEYNPLHFHGGRLSFVIWHRIPYDLAEEQASASHKGANQSAGPGTFTFAYPNQFAIQDGSPRVTGQAAQQVITHDIPLSKEHEGVFVLFPATLQHSVAPFYTSDGYRISVAGNLDFE